VRKTFAAYLAANEKTITQMETAITTVWRFKKY
jgi:hypothetical protein